MSNELKPCLRCNQKPVKRPRFLMGYAGDGIKCACGIETPVTLTGDAAVEWWNTRPSEDRIKAEGIREALAHLDERQKYSSAFLTGRQFLEQYADKLEGK